MAFSDGDASGWDECLPSVAECQMQTEAGNASIPDHGDLWRVPWQVLNSDRGLSYPSRCLLFPAAPAHPLHDPGRIGRRLAAAVLYSLTNMGAYRVPWAWSAHPLFAIDAGDEHPAARERPSTCA
jgi:hypothetical protein